MSEEIKKGLLGIVVDETTISHVVPELSALTYRGYKVQDLCDKCNFEGDTIGQEKINQYISDKDDAVLTNFTRCRIHIEGEISGVY